jgi:hypothetical protein
MGFSSAMLGVSGFETSAQFVESMQRGRFIGSSSVWVSSYRESGLYTWTVYRCRKVQYTHCLRMMYKEVGTCIHDPSFRRCILMSVCLAVSRLPVQACLSRRCATCGSA